MTYVTYVLYIDDRPVKMTTNQDYLFKLMKELQEKYPDKKIGWFTHFD